MAFFAVGCTNKEEVAVYASFTTDKDVYELKEDVVLVNTSYAENGYVSSSKWEWNGQYMWKLQPDAPISFTEVGEYEIKLTAIATTPSGNITSTCVKTIKVQDTNIRPVADFTYEPQSGIKAGDSVRFTDKSSDADGSIVSWTWRFGTTEVKERNPEFTFVEFGDIPVSLTVMDNMKGESTKEVVIHVDKSAFSLELLWEQAYETDKDAWIKFTSPATNADGSAVYAFSSGFHIAAPVRNSGHLTQTSTIQALIVMTAAKKEIPVLLRWIRTETYSLLWLIMKEMQKVLNMSLVYMQ